MGMDESMTKQETKEMMEQLEKVFSIDGVPGDSLPDDEQMGLVFPCIKKQGMRFLNEFH